MHVHRILAPLALALMAGAAQAEFFNFPYGFTVGPGAVMSYQQESNGNDFLQFTDVDPMSDMLMYIPLLQNWNWSDMIDGQLMFDARIVNGAPADWHAFGEFTFWGSNQLLTVDVVPAMTDPTSAWKRYVVDIDERTFGPSLKDVLADLQFITLNLESSAGAVEVIGIDRVYALPLPEPDSIWLALAGAGLAAACGARRRFSDPSSPAVQRPCA